LSVRRTPAVHASQISRLDPKIHTHAPTRLHAQSSAYLPRERPQVDTRKSPPDPTVHSQPFSGIARSNLYPHRRVRRLLYCPLASSSPTERCCTPPTIARCWASRLFNTVPKALQLDDLRSLVFVQGTTPTGCTRTCHRVSPPTFLARAHALSISRPFASGFALARSSC
jgi:hypothetical protein